jgi:hypothetical protein
MEPTESRDSSLRRTFFYVLAVGVLGAVIGLVAVGWRFGLGALAGSGVVVLNLAILARSVERLLTGEGARWGAVVVLKFVGLIAVTYFLLGLVALEPLGLALGFGSLPLGIVIASAFGSPGAGQTPALEPSPAHPPASPSSSASHKPS